MITQEPVKKYQWLSRFLPWAAALLVLATFFLTAGRLTDVMHHTGSSSAPPKSFDYSFTIKDLSNKKISFEQFRGKVVFINLWATWCGPCRAEMPTIETLYRKVQHNDIQFIMLSVDEDADQHKVRRFIEKNNYSFPVYMPSGNLPPLLQVPSIPTTFIVDKRGNIVRKKVGMNDFSTTEYVRLLNELANQ
jgi:thiol-disulfide isomerase/thioredoxin